MSPWIKLGTALLGALSGLFVAKKVLGSAALPKERKALADAMLAIARTDLEAPTIETGLNTDHGGRIDHMLASVDMPPGNPWCAAAITTWMREAAKTIGIAPPIKGGALARGWIPQFGKGWHEASEIRSGRGFKRGDILVWERGPSGTNQGHIGIVESVNDDGSAETIEGNSGTGDRVAKMTRHTNDPKLLGAGVFA